MNCRTRKSTLMRLLNACCAAAVSLSALASVSCAADHGEAITDASKSGPDFQVQGEYVGDVKIGDKTVKYGAQIIALGDGAFDAVVYTGGLPGDGWQRGDDRKKVGGKTVDGVTTFVGDKWTAKLADGKIAVTGSGGESLGTLTKTERKSPTLGEKPPAGAQILFDGTNADQFKNGKMTEDTGVSRIMKLV